MTAMPCHPTFILWQHSYTAPCRAVALHWFATVSNGTIIMEECWLVLGLLACLPIEQLQIGAIQQQYFAGYVVWG